MFWEINKHSSEQWQIHSAEPIAALPAFAEVEVKNHLVQYNLQPFHPNQATPAYGFAMGNHHSSIKTTKTLNFPIGPWLLVMELLER
jgi:hypothetical protein